MKGFKKIDNKDQFYFRCIYMFKENLTLFDIKEFLGESKGNRFSNIYRNLKLKRTSKASNFVSIAKGEEFYRSNYQTL